MTTDRDGLSLAELVDFEWHRSEDAIWVPWEQREAFLPLHLRDYWRTEDDVLCPGSSDARAMMGIPRDRFDDDPWLGAHAGSAYDPLKEHPALFREFADLADDPSAYLAFAREYGPLTQFVDVHLPETLSLWEWERRAIGAAVYYFDALKGGNVDEARRRINTSPAHPFEGAGALLAHYPTTAMYVSDLFSPDWADGPLCTNVVTADATPREVVQAVLLRLVWDGLKERGATPGLTLDGRIYGTGLRLTFEVRNLAAAMWLQLLLAVDGNRDYERCPVCRRWYDATGARSHKKVCSDKCRAKKSYQERQKAKKHAEGKG